MAEITNDVARKFLAERPRRSATKALALLAELDLLIADWDETDGIASLFATDADEFLEDRDRDGWRRVTAANVKTIITAATEIRQSLLKHRPVLSQFSTRRTTVNE